ncbi:DUF2865 domain-containing protein [Mesorhizobium retamae]|uniref:DUF2865 domain-containing protein n=1 Tax=Mesorhizobium retamae TaxID=2912854 RepID=A0ABS9QPE4_9HYPH|nr:DUF2865 domain-containing protein [Mesorhizobium sp. IRAMC:0171]MCG7509322.1 DUF2865 domain-containing protein [Mesorhizobium sp. IRAMC:0171]
MSQMEISRGRRKAMRLGSCLLLICLAICFAWSSAHAKDCIDRVQNRFAYRNTANVEATALRRQLAAITRLEQQRRCSAASLGGFFNACRDLAFSKAGIEDRLSKLGAGSARGAERLRARYSRRNCAPARKQRAPETTQAIAQAPKQRVSGRGMFFCVRLQDGYYFPAPNSQFVGPGYAESLLDRCRYICNGDNVDLYMLADPAQETEEMVSVSQKQPYKDLPAAFRYRDASDFTQCNFRNYHLRAALARAKEATLATYKNVKLPLPQPRPDLPGDVKTSLGSPAEIGVPLRGNVFRSKIRVIMPDVLPANSTRIPASSPTSNTPSPGKAAM